MAQHFISSPFETFGAWYLPGKESKPIHGVLTYTPKKIELSLSNALIPIYGDIYANNAEIYPVIYGVTKENELVTIFDAQQASISFIMNEGRISQPEKVQGSLMVIGAHVAKDALIPSMRFCIPGLHLWLTKEVLHAERHQDNEGDFSELYVVKTPEPTITPILNDEVNIEWGTSIERKTDYFVSLNIKSIGYVAIRPVESKSIHWYLHKCEAISTMLTLLTGSPMYPNLITARLPVEQKVLADILHRQYDAKYCTLDDRHEFFMLCNRMDIDLSVVVDTWFSVYDKIKIPSSLAVNVLSSEDLWTNVEFLLLAQALEGFHRSLYDGVYMDEIAYESVKKTLGDAIPSGLDKAHKDSLKSRIRYGNQVSLGKRLDSLADLLILPLRKSIFGADGKIPRTWIDTRNYYTHWDETLKAKVLEGQEFYNAIVRMRLFLRVLYLNLMGIPQDAILASLNGTNSLAQHILQINASEARAKDPSSSAGVLMTITKVPSKEAASKESSSPKASESDSHQS